VLTARGGEVSAPALLRLPPTLYNHVVVGFIQI